MHWKPTFFYALTCFACMLSSGLFANTLEEKNPFLPPGYGTTKAAPQQPIATVNGPISREIEFRGIVQIDDTYQFSVFNKSEQKGYWLRLNESEDGISVRGFDASSKSITLTLNGRSERLTLMSESDAPLPVAISVTTPQPTPTPPTLPTGSNAPQLPPQLGNPPTNTNAAASGENRRRVIPRRRVVLPKK